MNRIFTLLSLCLLSIAATAQKYVFTDEAGNLYEEGAVINRTEVENEDIFMPQINSGLFVKNNGATENSKVAIAANITKIDNGSLQLCFPMSCDSYSTIGQRETQKTSLVRGESQNIQSEWMPYEVGAYGECSVTYTAKTYEGSMVVGVFSVTVNYKYSNAAGIEPITQPSDKVGQYYNLQGSRIGASLHGLNIVRMKDGSVRKVIIK
ncbi:MAG: hypothetical protein K6F47_09375 [Bacteroidaceae bacterium]|nr:hypothetical protein [Bacteroidaceae bacterium]